MPKLIHIRIDDEGNVTIIIPEETEHPTREEYKRIIDALSIRVFHHDRIEQRVSIPEIP